MKKLLFILSLAVLLCSCENETLQDYTAAAPAYYKCLIEGVYQSESGKLADFGTDYMFFDMTISEEATAIDYNNSYYIPFSGVAWQTIENYSVTPEGITFDFYDMHTEKTLHFTVTKLSCEDVNITFTDGIITKDRGTFTKLL